jgi:hypothetical protein
MECRPANPLAKSTTCTERISTDKIMTIRWRKAHQIQLIHIWIALQICKHVPMLVPRNCYGWNRCSRNGSIDNADRRQEVILQSIDLRLLEKKCVYYLGKL